MNVGCRWCCGVGLIVRNEGYDKGNVNGGCCQSFGVWMLMISRMGFGVMVFLLRFGSYCG